MKDQAKILFVFLIPFLFVFGLSVFTDSNQGYKQDEQTITGVDVKSINAAARFWGR